MFIVYNFFQTLFFIFRHVFRTKTKHSQPLIFWNKKTEERTRNSEPDQIWSNLIKSDQIWSKLRFDQIWSNLIKFDQIWSDLVKLVFFKKIKHTKIICLFCFKFFLGTGLGCDCSSFLLNIVWQWRDGCFKKTMCFSKHRFLSCAVQIARPLVIPSG